MKLHDTHSLRFRLHVPLAFGPSLPALTAASITLFTASLVASMLLIHRHRRLEKASATQAVSHYHLLLHLSR